MAEKTELATLPVATQIGDGDHFFVHQGNQLLRVPTSLLKSKMVGDLQVGGVNYSDNVFSNNTPNSVFKYISASDLTLFKGNPICVKIYQNIEGFSRFYIDVIIGGNTKTVVQTDITKHATIDVPESATSIRVVIETKITQTLPRVKCMIERANIPSDYRDKL